MANMAPLQAVIAEDGNPNPNQKSVELLLLNTDGTLFSVVKQAAAQADSEAADVAGLVADFNSLLAKLRTSGALASS